MEAIPVEANALSEDGSAHQSVRNMSESTVGEGAPLLRLNTHEPINFGKSAVSSAGEHQAVYLREKLGLKQETFVGAFVGHGPHGKEIAAFAKEAFVKIALNTLGKSRPEAFLARAFSRVQDEIEKNYPQTAQASGTTATIVWLCKDCYYCANVGDSSAMLVKTSPNSHNGETPQLFGTGTLLTEDHTMWNQRERKRIETTGGVDVISHKCSGVELGKPIILEIEKRISSVLSRSLGDIALKEHGGLVVPHVGRFEWDDNDTMLLIGNGAFWDIADYRCAAQQCADLLGTYQENVGVIAARLKDRMQQACHTNEGFSFLVLLFNRSIEVPTKRNQSYSCIVS